MARKHVVFCNANDGFEASLERLKFYVALEDAQAAAHGQIRVIDESGEDYLYPASYFANFPIPQSVRKSVLGSVAAKSVKRARASPKGRLVVRGKGAGSARRAGLKASA